MTREEHLDWCKGRALEYVKRGELQNAVASMLSDLTKHDETMQAGQMMRPIGLHEAVNGTPDSVRRFIEGFN